VRTRRRWAAAEALELGHGGISAVSRATELTPRAIRHGINEISQREGSNDDALSEGKQRKPGGGRKKLSAKQPGLLDALEKLVDPYTSGDPMGPLRWTCKSTANLSSALQMQGFSVSASSVRAMLKNLGYSLQSNRKRFEGKQSPDRNQQFEYIATMTDEFQGRGVSCNIR